MVVVETVCDLFVGLGFCACRSRTWVAQTCESEKQTTRMASAVTIWGRSRTLSIFHSPKGRPCGPASSLPVQPANWVCLSGSAWSRLQLKDGDTYWVKGIRSRNMLRYSTATWCMCVVKLLCERSGGRGSQSTLDCETGCYSTSGNIYLTVKQLSDNASAQESVQYFSSSHMMQKRKLLKKEFDIIQICRQCLSSSFFFFCIQ